MLDLWSLTISNFPVAAKSKYFSRMHEIFVTQSQLLTTLGWETFENILGKGENAGNQHFLPFPKYFLHFQKQNSNFSVTIILLSAKAFNLDHSKILSFGKELNPLCTTLDSFTLGSFRLVPKMCSFPIFLVIQFIFGCFLLNL